MHSPDRRGGGFRRGLLDATALLWELRSASTVQQVPAVYQRARLGPVISHVWRSQRASQAYLRRASSWA